jgi:hypothetical protein
VPPVERAAARSGLWSYGAFNDNAFVFNAGDRTTPAMVISANKQMIVHARNGAAAANLKHTGISDGVIALGNYYIGMKDKDNFVINTKGLAASASPQLVIRWDGEIYTSGDQQNGPPATWSIIGNEGAVNVKRFGSWWMGDKGGSHFVINRAGASTPQFLLRSDGHLWIGSQDGPPPPNFYMAPPWCQDSDTPTYATAFKDTAWTVASKSGNAIISRAGAFAPSMVLSESYLTANFKGSVLSGRQLKASDPGVVVVGNWLVGFHDDVFVICTTANAGTNWPQFALDTNGNLFARAITGNAGVEWSLDGPNVVSLCVCLSLLLLNRRLGPLWRLAYRI